MCDASSELKLWGPSAPSLPQNQFVLEGSRILDVQLGSQDEDNMRQSRRGVHKK